MRTTVLNITKRSLNVLVESVDGKLVMTVMGRIRPGAPIDLGEDTPAARAQLKVQVRNAFHRMASPAARRFAPAAALLAAGAR